MGFNDKYGHVINFPRLVSLEVSGFLASYWSIVYHHRLLIGWWWWHLGSAGGLETRPKLWRTYSRHSFPPRKDLVHLMQKRQEFKAWEETQNYFGNINSFYGKTPILFSVWERPNLTDRLERFFNTSISHFILFWNTEYSSAAEIQSIWAPAACLHCEEWTPQNPAPSE